MDRYRKEVLQVSTRKHGINVQYLYDRTNSLPAVHIPIRKNGEKFGAWDTAPKMLALFLNSPKCPISIKKSVICNSNSQAVQ